MPPAGVLSRFKIYKDQCIMLSASSAIQYFIHIVVARSIVALELQSHNLKVVGSNPTPATKFTK